jgi:hypothetical protein
MQPKILPSFFAVGSGIGRCLFGRARWLTMFFIFAASLSMPFQATHAQLRQNRAEPGGAPTIEHFSVSFGVEGKPIAIEAQVVAPGRSVIYVRIYYKSPSLQAYVHTDMRPGLLGYVGQIPGNAVRAPAVQYFLVALLSDNSVINYPSKNPYGQPFEVSVRESAAKSIDGEQAPKSGTGAKAAPSPPAFDPALEVSPQLLDKLKRLERPTAEAPADTNGMDTASPETLLTGETEPLSPILALSPEPFSSVAAGDLVIAASFLTETAIDSSSIQILLDGREVTNKAQVSAAMVSYTPAQIAPGEHTVTITARDEFGQEVGPASWAFQITGKSAAVADERPRTRATGSVFAEVRREKFGSRSLNNNNIGADLTGDTGPLFYSASAYFTSLEDNAFQPRNRFVLSTGLSWLNFTLGDATPYFNELVLWGRRARGMQAGLHTGIINFDFVSGETVRKVDPLYVAVNGQNTRQRFGTYKQTLLGLRPSFGSPNGFLWGFTLLKVRDDKNSLPIDTSSVIQIGKVTPRDNLVLGTDVTLAFDRRRFEIKASGAWSLMTNDISQGPLSPDSLKKISDVDLPFDPKNFGSARENFAGVPVGLAIQLFQSLHQRRVQAPRLGIRLARPFLFAQRHPGFFRQRPLAHVAQPGVRHTRSRELRRSFQHRRRASENESENLAIGLFAFLGSEFAVAQPELAQSQPGQRHRFPPGHERRRRPDHHGSPGR